jgi:hypothetical protein
MSRHVLSAMLYSTMPFIKSMRGFILWPDDDLLQENKKEQIKAK